MFREDEGHSPAARGLLSHVHRRQHRVRVNDVRHTGPGLVGGERTTGQLPHQRPFDVLQPRGHGRNDVTDYDDAVLLPDGGPTLAHPSRDVTVGD
jgi:hypothetical protein